MPDRCIAYYTLDGTTPTESSEIYTGEFLMPMGSSIVKAFLVDAKGISSEISTVYYTCTEVIQN